MLTQVGDNPLDFAECPGTGIAIGCAQTGTQQVIATEHIERQITVVAIVAVKETPFLFAVQRIVRGIQIQHQRLGRCGL